MGISDVILNTFKRFFFNYFSHEGRYLKKKLTDIVLTQLKISIRTVPTADKIEHLSQMGYIQLLDEKS